MYGLRYGALLALLWLPTSLSYGYSDTADFYINAYTYSYTEKWLSDDLARRQSELGKSGQVDEREHYEDEDEDDELFSGRDMLRTSIPYLYHTGEYAKSYSYGVYGLADLHPNSMNKVAYVHFVKLLSTFEENAKKTYQVPPNHLATGVTVLLAGGYAAYHNKPFPVEAIRPTVEQTRETLHAAADFIHVKMDEKLKLYQKATGFGLHLQLVQAEMAKNPDPEVIAKMRKIGEKILRDTLNADPERISFTTKGIVIR